MRGEAIPGGVGAWGRGRRHFPIGYPTAKPPERAKRKGPGEVLVPSKARQRSFATHAVLLSPVRCRARRGRGIAPGPPNINAVASPWGINGEGAVGPFSVPLPRRVRAPGTMPAAVAAAARRPFQDLQYKRFPKQKAHPILRRLLPEVLMTQTLRILLAVTLSLPALTGCGNQSNGSGTLDTSPLEETRAQNDLAADVPANTDLLPSDTSDANQTSDLPLPQDLLPEDLASTDIPSEKDQTVEELTEDLSAHDSAPTDVPSDTLDSDTLEDLGFQVPPFDQVSEKLIGIWDLVAYLDSGNAPQQVPPGTQFNIFSEDGTVKLQCNQPMGMAWTLVEKWNMPTIQVTISEGSEVFWVITRLTDSELWYVEGGDEFRHARRAECNP